jgi:hypothetical protein
MLRSSLVKLYGARKTVAPLRRTKPMRRDGNLDLRGRVPLTRHILRFDIPAPPSTESSRRNADKAQLRAGILAMLAQGMSYREIGVALGIHWTRVGQIVRATN